jgi:hypothetical protein
MLVALGVNPGNKKITQTSFLFLLKALVHVYLETQQISSKTFVKIRPYSCEFVLMNSYYLIRVNSY